MKLLFTIMFPVMAHLTAAQLPTDVRTPTPERFDGANDAGSQPSRAGSPGNGNAEEKIPDQALIAEDSRGRTHNNGEGHRMSFADAVKLLGRRGKWVQTNLRSVQKAYNEGGVFGIAEYLATLPEVVGGLQVVEFSDVKLVRDSNTPVVTASMKEPMPLNGPPFYFDLTSVLPQVLDGILDTKIIRTAQGERIRVVVAHNPSIVLLNVTSGMLPPMDVPPVQIPATGVPSP